MVGPHESPRAPGVTASSPDGQLKARLDDETLSVGFRPGTYRRYSDTSLAEQLARVLTSVWAEYHKRQLKALSEAHGEVYRTRPVDWRAEHRAYDEAAARLVTRGTSPGGGIDLKAKGFTEWKVRIAAGTLARLDEADFLAELLGGYRRLQGDDRRKTALLKDEHFGLVMPPSWRARTPR